VASPHESYELGDGVLRVYTELNYGFE